MSILPVHGITTSSTAGISASPQAKTASSVAGKSDGGFTSVLSNFVKDANNQQNIADQAIENFVTGKDDNIQNVVVSMAKADLSFRMVMEVRNQLMESYQEIMRMQV